MWPIVRFSLNLAAVIFIVLPLGIAALLILLGLFNVAV